MARVMDESIARCFSESYEEARAKFIEEARAASAQLHSLEICKDAAAAYTTDIAILPGSGPCLVVVSSGTHGVEGYAGSAIQVHLLRMLRTEQVGPTVVMVHAVNPYGMAHFRRWNEHNVDLNRNALREHHLQQLVARDCFGDVYGGFSHMFNPPRAPGWLYSKVGIWLDMAFQVMRHGFVRIKTALVVGTYAFRNSKGVFYGGQTLQSSHVKLRDFMRKHFSHVPASDVAWVDVHTGLGPCGVDVLLCDSHTCAEMRTRFPAIAREFDGVQSPDQGTSTDERVALRSGAEALVPAAGGPANQSAGYEMAVGLLGRSEWLSEFFKPQSGAVLAFTQEFGTCSGLAVARALFLENAGFQYDRANHAHWRSYTRDAFYVRTPDWKRRVLRRGQDVFLKLVARATEKSAS